jgi:hypothetical protein
MLAPVGMLQAKEISTPSIKQTTERIPEHITTDLKVLKSRIEVSAGKIIKLEMSIAPIIRIPITIITAVKRAKRIL